MGTKRAQHLFDLSQKSCQEQSALETPRGGMDPAVLVVLLTGWSRLMLGWDLWSQGPWSGHGVVTGTPQLAAYPSSHPPTKECDPSHQVFCFYLKPHKKNKISQFPCTISTINKTCRLHTWLQVQTGQCRQPGPAPPSPAPNKTLVEKTQTHLQTEICTWQGKEQHPELCTQTAAEKQPPHTSARHPTETRRARGWTQDRNRGKPKRKTRGSAAVEARHGLETHMNYK